MQCIVSCLLSMEELLTVVLVTSPVPCHPSTEMLEWVLRSYVANADGLWRCPKIIVSDGFTITARSEGQQSRVKLGRIPLEWAAPYSEYRERLDVLCKSSIGGAEETLDAAALAFMHCKHMPMDRHRGFGGCLEAALPLVTTPYVLVLQHDRPCHRAFDCRGILAAMEGAGGVVKYVGLPTKASLARSHPEQILNGCQIRVDEESATDSAVSEAAASSGIQLRLLLFWYDSTHICQTKHYRYFVFEEPPPMVPRRVAKGGFPEDSMGQAMHQEICAAARNGKWRDVHATYGTYIYVPSDGLPLVGHVRGRRYLSSDVLNERGWGGWSQNVPACDSQRPTVATQVRASDADSEGVLDEGDEEETAEWNLFD
eukprot:gnl/TRDRNA2_/TRDRNA2_91028_c0_seq1.p1 gnl/TRDRNA2_/TRDRNA2_91028_c0~~gnl/TRDRNA2_/TRDRNA2_91028_c0_seq1.p1  ORF type:complete len:370 (+),score=55.33 gnl/TRDRNA2_/TRDRNA2_91028_c0_seq1:139-1248(+)